MSDILEGAKRGIDERHGVANIGGTLIHGDGCAECKAVKDGIQKRRRDAVENLKGDLEKAKSALAVSEAEVERLRRSRTADSEILKKRIIEALTEELGDTYDCLRVWEAWSVGTMSQNDFLPVMDRAEDIAGTIIEKIGGEKI